jgi:hypothetical protein
MIDSTKAQYDVYPLLQSPFCMALVVTLPRPRKRPSVLVFFLQCCVTTDYYVEIATYSQVVLARARIAFLPELAWCQSETSSCHPKGRTRGQR